MSIPFLAGLAVGLGLLAAALLTPAVRGAAIASGIVRGSQVDRWHRRPTPAIGGVAIFAAFLLAVGLLYFLDADVLGQGLEEVPPNAILTWATWEGLLVAVSVAFVIGLIDDLSPLSALTKLAGQMIAASILLLSGVGVWLTGNYAIDAAISMFWFIGVTNALNLLDNMDGVAGGTAAIAAAYLGILFLLEGQIGLLLITLAFAGALIGFLAHNYPPARIFMGDSGSLFLGIFLSGMALAPAPGLSRSLLAVLAVPALVLAIPILDTTLVTVGRILEGRSIAEGGTDHTSHRLVALGVTEERAMWLLWALAAAGGAIGILLRTVARPTALLLGGGMLVFLVVLGGWLLSVRFRRFKKDDQEQVPIYRVALALHAQFPLGVFLLDAFLIVLAYYGAYLLRWDSGQLEAELAYFNDSVMVVVAVKLLVLTVAGGYVSRWQTFSLDDALRVGRAVLLGSVAVAAVLLLVDRTGLSRGVLFTDFVLSLFVLLGLRLSFRYLEGASKTLSLSGLPAVLIGSDEDVDVMLRVLDARTPRDGEAQIRPVAVADPEFTRLRGRVRGLPLFGTPNGISNALHETPATAVVLAVRGGDELLPDPLREYLKEHGAVDVFRLRVAVERVEEYTRPQ